MLSFFQLYCYVVNGFSIICNVILLVLSAHKSIETIQELRYFLSNISVAGGIFSLGLLLIQPQMVARGMMTIRVPHGPINIFSNYVVKILSSISVTFYMYGMLSFPLFFIYRSMILANSTVYGQYFNKRNLLVTFLVIFVFCCVEGACLYYSNIPYEDLFGRLNLTSNALDAFDENVGGKVVAAHSAVDAPPMTTPVYQNVSGVVAMSEENNKRKIPLFGDDYTRNPLILYFHGIAVFSHGISYIIILISAHFMLNTLKRKQVSMSLDTFLANEVLVHAVFAEAFLPLLLAAPVAANALLTTFYENSLIWQEFLPMYLISLVPLLSPIISICFIKPYRDTMIYFLTLQFFRSHAKSLNDAGAESNINGGN